MPDVVVTSGADNSLLKQGMAELRNVVHETEGAVTDSFGKMFSPRTLVIAGLEEGVRGLIEYGAKVFDLSQRFGVSTDALQRFGNAAEKNGSSMEGVARAFNKLEIAQSKALDGDQALIDHFAALNISVDDLKKLSPDQIMAKIGTSAMNAADLVAVLGRNGLELRPTLQGIASDTVEIGRAISGIDISKLKAADDAFRSLWETIRYVFGSALANITSGLDEESHQWMATFANVKEAASAVWDGIKAIALGDIKIISAALKGDFAGAMAAAQEVNNQAKAAADRLNSVLSIKGLLNESGPGGQIMQDWRNAQTTKATATSSPNPVAGLGDGIPDDSGGSAGAGGSGAGAISLQERLDEMQEERYKNSLSASDRLAEIDEQRNALQERLNDLAKVGGGYDGEEEEIKIAMLKLDNESDTLQADELEKQKQYAASVYQARVEAEKQVTAVDRQNQLLVLTQAGYGDIAQGLQQQWELEDKIQEAIDAANEAWAEGNQELAEQDEKLTSELETQKELVAAANAKAYAEKAASNYMNDQLGIAEEMASGLEDQMNNIQAIFNNAPAGSSWEQAVDLWQQQRAAQIQNRQAQFASMLQYYTSGGPDRTASLLNQLAQQPIPQLGTGGTLGGSVDDSIAIMQQMLDQLEGIHDKVSEPLG